MPDSLIPKSLSTFSLVYLLAWHPQLHTAYISSPNHCLLFAVHAHTIATCFAVVPRLCHLILVSLNLLLGTISCSLMPHIHLNILISTRWCATSFSFLMGQVSLPCNIVFHTKLLYNLPLTVNDISLLVSNCTKCLNLFHPIRILASAAAVHLCLHSTCQLNNKTYPTWGAWELKSDSDNKAHSLNKYKYIHVLSAFAEPAFFPQLLHTVPGAIKESLVIIWTSFLTPYAFPLVQAIVSKNWGELKALTLTREIICSVSSFLDCWRTEGMQHHLYHLSSGQGMNEIHHHLPNNWAHSTSRVWWIL